MIRINIKLKELDLTEKVYVGKQFRCANSEGVPYGNPWTVYEQIGERIYYRCGNIKLDCPTYIMEALFHDKSWIPIN